MPSQRNIQREIGIYIFLAVITAALFWPVRTHDFINYDDQLYITSNHQVQSGLTSENVKWAFGRLVGNGTYWHPVTWLSHMLDCQLFKMDAGKHHLVSLLLHLLNTLLLFTLLNRMTKTIWRSAIVAALFAVHPFQVDSVAWIAERKNLLSTFFGLLTMLLYLRFTIKKCKVHYLLALLCFALTLMCKPFVTLPCVLLLLDIWPLGRVFSVQSSVSSGKGARTEHWKLNTEYFPRLLLEKLPFIALSITSGIITILAHKKLELVAEVSRFSFGSRLANATVSYWRYVRKTFWPNDLAVYYPLPEAWPTWMVIGAAVFVVGVSFLAFWTIKKRPYLFTGWFWFFGTLVPFIGLMQVNDQAMADRFAYVPLIGLFIALVWGISEIVEKFSLPKIIKPSLAVAAIALSAWATSAQLSHWKNSETLFTHALKVTKRNNIAHINLGAALENYGTPEKLAEAQSHYEQALAIEPANSMAESNLGVILAKLGRLNDAMPHFTKAVEINSENADAHSNLGLAFSYLKRPDDAIKELKEAIRIKPAHAQARHNLANLLAQQGKPAEAVEHYEESLRYDPGNADAHNNFGLALLKLRRNEDAKKQFEAALELRPDQAQAHYNLASIAKAEGKNAEAIQHYNAAVNSNPNYAEAHYELGLLLKNENRSSEARSHLQEAARLRPEWKERIDVLLQGN